MANTTNLNLSKLAGTEKLKNFPSPYNDNMDAIDGAFGSGFGVAGASNVNAEINALGDGLAIIANGNTHAAITSGQFVYVRQHSTLADGLYVASSNISANGTLSGSNLTADASGGLNVLNSNITGKFGTNYGNSTNPITNLDDLPINGVGYATLSATLSPTGALASFSFIKSGAINGNRYNVLVKRVASSENDSIYFGSVYDGTLLGWQQLALNANCPITLSDTQKVFSSSKEFVNYCASEANNYRNKLVILKASITSGGFFGASGFIALMNFSTSNYGCILCISDNYTIGGGIVNITKAVNVVKIHKPTVTTEDIDMT